MNILGVKMLKKRILNSNFVVATIITITKSVYFLMKKNSLNSAIDALKIEKISVNTGYKQRSDTVLTLTALIQGFMNAYMKQLYTLEAWAMEISLLVGKNVDKQGIQAKFHDRQVGAVKTVLETALAQRLQDGLKNTVTYSRKWKLFEAFNRVLIEDSTCQKVDASLASTFPTTNGGDGQVSATMRIQAIYDFVAEAFAFFSVESYCDNDQKAASNILKIAQAGDLVLRDRGYWVIKVLAEMSEKSIYWLSLWQPGVGLMEDGTKEKINLLALLRKTQGDVVDTNVLLGAGDKLPVRLVALRLPEPVAAEKRRKARLAAKKTKNHSAEYYELLGWSIFVTNVSTEIWTSKQISYAYRVRWRIETIFKCWKSVFKFKQFALQTKVLPHRVYMSVYIILLLYTLLFKTVFNYFNEAVILHHQRLGLPPETCPKLSMMKMAAIIMQFFYKMVQVSDWAAFVPIFYKFAAYQDPKYRPNFETFSY
jgi:hypothetical protein